MSGIVLFQYDLITNQAGTEHGSILSEFEGEELESEFRHTPYIGPKGLDMRPEDAYLYQVGDGLNESILGEGYPSGELHTGPMGNSANVYLYSGSQTVGQSEYQLTFIESDNIDPSLLYQTSPDSSSPDSVDSDLDSRASSPVADDSIDADGEAVYSPPSSASWHGSPASSDSLVTDEIPLKIEKTDENLENKQYHMSNGSSAAPTSQNSAADPDSHSSSAATPTPSSEESSSKPLRRHQRKRSWQCDWCTEQYTNERKYEAHLRKKHGVKSIRCPECGGSVARKDYMKDHVNSKKHRKALALRLVE